MRLVISKNPGFSLQNRLEMCLKLSADRVSFVVLVYSIIRSFEIGNHGSMYTL